MNTIKRSRWPNLMNILLLVTTGVLVANLFVPTWTAERVARVEGRAMAIARVLAEAAQQAGPDFDPAAEDAHALLAGTLDPLLAELGLPDSSTPQVRDPLEQAAGVLFENKHYFFLLTRDEERGDEVYAWPTAHSNAAHTVFCFPEGEFPVYTRNLTANYAGRGRPPGPGDGRRRLPELEEGQEPTPEEELPRQYRGRYDERWLVFEPPG